ncbi:MAG: carboxylesterase family protein [Caldilineaceae bacterium]
MLPHRSANCAGNRPSRCSPGPARDATRFGPRHATARLWRYELPANGMGEDCLYLNVWTPAPAPDAKLPVLVYFYGGGFIAGDGSERATMAQPMAQRGIVAVTVNYRLNIFGFLPTPNCAPNRRTAAPATMAISTKMPRCTGCVTISRPLAAIRAGDYWRGVGGVDLGECPDGVAALKRVDCRRHRL